MNIQIGTTLYRTKAKYPKDRDLLTVIDIDTDYVQLQDSNGIYWTPIKKLDGFFTINTEPEDFIDPVTNKKLDDQSKHSIASEMNDPSPIQIKAFNQDNE